jgi:hypothetical protein
MAADAFAFQKPQILSLVQLRRLDPLEPAEHLHRPLRIQHLEGAAVRIGCFPEVIGVLPGFRFERGMTMTGGCGTGGAAEIVERQVANRNWARRRCVDAG